MCGNDYITVDQLRAKAKAGEIFSTLGSTVKNLKFTYLTIITVVMTGLAKKLLAE